MDVFFDLDRKYCCTKCDMKYLRSHHLSRHIKNHKNFKFKCLTCDQSYCHSRFLKMHQLFADHQQQSVLTCTSQNPIAGGSEIPNELDNQIEDNSEMSQIKCKLVGLINRIELNYFKGPENMSDGNLGSSFSDGCNLNEVNSIVDVEGAIKKDKKTGILNLSLPNRKRRKLFKSYNWRYDRYYPVKKSLPQIPITKSSTHTAMNDRKYPCPVCHKRFKARNHLREHISIHSDTPNYKCKICQMEFKAPGSWRQHLRVNHGFKCSVCEKVFSTILKLREHKVNSNHQTSNKQKLEDEEGRIDEDSSGNTGLKMSRKTGQSNKIISKIIKKSKRNGNIATPGTHNGMALIKCHMCELKFSLERSLRRHIDAKHNGNSFRHKCKFCGYETNRADYFRIHINRHKEGTQIRCKVRSCSMKFFSNKSLGNHLRAVHGSIKLEENGEVEEVDDDLKNESISTEEPSSGQLKIADCFTIEPVCAEKELDSSVSYECCDCKIKFADNDNLWAHLMATHFNKVKKGC